MREDADAEKSAKLWETAMLWRARAFMFASAMFEPQVQLHCDQCVIQDRHEAGPKYRIKKGVPDHPYSLSDGISAQIAFISELLNNEKELRFPGYEI